MANGDGHGVRDTPEKCDNGKHSHGSLSTSIMHLKRYRNIPAGTDDRAVSETGKHVQRK